MGFSRSIGSLVVRIAAEGIGAYKSDLNAAADATSQAAGKMETSANRAVNAAKNMGGGMGQAAQGAEVVMAAAGGAGLAVGVLAAGFGLAGVAAYQGAKEKQAYAQSLILTGNAAGVTTGQLADMAKGISSSVGTTGQAAAALAAMAGSGAVAGGSLQKFSQVAVEMERTVGQKVADTVSQFAELGNAPVVASLKLNQSMNYLTASTFAQIKAAEDLGDKTTAGALAQTAYADALDSASTRIKANLGTLEKLWKGLKDTAMGAWDAMLGLGREQSAGDKLADVDKQLGMLRAKRSNGFDSNGGGAAFGGASTASSAKLERDIGLLEVQRSALQENVKLAQRSATLQAEKAATEKAGIAGVMAVTAANTKALDKQEQMNRALEDYSKSLAAIKEADPASKLLKPELIAKTEAAIRAQFADKGGRGGSAAAKVMDYERMAEAIGKVTALQQQELDHGGKLSASAKYQFDEMQKINFALQTKKISQLESIKLTDMTTVAVAKMVEVEKQAANIKANVAGYADEIQFRKELFDAEENVRQARQRSTETLLEYSKAVEADNELTAFELSLVGQTEEAKRREIALYRVEIELLKQKDAIKKNMPYDAAGQSEAFAKAEATAAISRAGVTSKAQLDAANKYKDEQVKLWSEIDAKAESVFMDMALNGKSAFKHLEDELKNGLLKLLYEMTVKKWIISIGSDMAGFDISGLLGGGSGGNPLTKMAGDWLMEGAGSLFGGGSAVVGAGAGAGVTTTTLAGIEAASAGLATVGTTAAAAGGATAAAGVGLGGMATAALAAIPVVGWVALGIGALFAIFGSGKDKIPTVLNDLALFNNSLVGLPFLELAIGSDDAAQGLRDVLYGLENATPTMRKLAGETIQLSVELMRASGDIAGARNLQRNLGTRGMNDEEIAVFDYNEQLRDQIEAHRNAAAAASAGAAAAQAAAQAENTLAQTRYDLAGRLNVLLGRQTQQQFDRAKELAGATDAAVIAMLNEIYAIEDLTAARDASFATLERSIAAEKKIADLRLKSATDLAAALKTTKDAISPSLDRASAQSQIAMYVALAKAGGVLPTAAALKPALDSIAKPSEDLFRTFEDYAIDQARTANDISDLAGFADAQVSEAQQAIERLDLQLETSKNQLDVLKGVDNSVLSVAEAVRNFEASMLAVATAQASAGNYSFAAPTPASSYSGGGGGGYSGGGGSTAASATAGMDSDIVAAFNTYYGRDPDAEGYKHFVSLNLAGDAMMQAILHASIANKAGADYAYAIAHGYDPENPLSNYYHGTGKYKATTASGVGIDGSFAVGYNDMPRDAVVQVHKGEDIVPRPYVDMQRASRDETNALMRRLVESNERLERKVETLQAAADKTAANTGKTADTLQGQQGVPFLVEIAQ